MDPESVKRFRHVLLNSLGGSRDEVSAQIHHVQMEPGDRLLLCTDGLTEMVDDEDITGVLQHIPAPQEACDRLVALALEKGGKDNVTVLLAAAGSPDA